DFSHIRTLSNLVAKYSEQQISEETPLLSATLPGGYRVQIVLPPAVEAETVAISIRKQALLDISLGDYEKLGAFKTINQKSAQDLEKEERLQYLFKEGEFPDFVETALLAKKNILISAGTSTGKTTFLNACLKAIPHKERILTIEDAREVKLSHPN